MTPNPKVNDTSGPRLRLWFWRGLLVLLTAFLSWQIILQGLATQGLTEVGNGDLAAAQRVLRFRPQHPEALYVEASVQMPNAPDQAQAQLRTAFSQDPTRGMVLLSLAELALAREDTSTADALAEQAVTLQPVKAAVLRRAATYWLSRGQVDRGLQLLSQALLARKETNQDLLDTFLKLAEDPVGRVALAPLAQEFPSWWPDFFARVALRATDLDTVRFLYGLRALAPQHPLTLPERQTYMQRLLKDGQIAEAYLTWITGLTERERREMGLLHNGGFEIPLGTAGFDWRWTPLRQVTANTAATLGVSGERALQLVFRNHEGSFHHLRQALFLDPGTYRLSGKIRADSLATQGGLRWALTCLQPPGLVLGQGERFLGSEKWRDFALDFAVPDQCQLQEIRLESASSRPHEQRVTGEIWFDDLAIRRTSGLSAAAKADERARDRGPDAEEAILFTPDQNQDQATQSQEIKAE